MGFDLGNGGPNRDGVDGVYGAKTRTALLRHLGVVEVGRPPPASTAVLPKAYAWINDLPSPLPRMLQEGLDLLGTLETPGAGNNPTIMAWAQETGLERIYTADSVPWCGLYMAVVAKRAGRKFPNEPLWALNWLKFGESVGQPWLGDVLCFQREGGGHVGMYVAEDHEAYHVLGGNQSDKVSITRIAKSRLRGARRVPYINAPTSAKPYIVSGAGALSKNEA